MKNIDHMNLEQLENDDWAEPEHDSYLVTTCYRLRKKNLRDFTTEDLRIMIGQDIGSKYLLPKAIDILRETPFAAGDFYKFDLLVSVARLPNDSLPKDKQSKDILIHICQFALDSNVSELSKEQHAIVEVLLHRLQL